MKMFSFFDSLIVKITRYLFKFLNYIFRKTGSYLPILFENNYEILSFVLKVSFSILKIMALIFLNILFFFIELLICFLRFHFKKLLNKLIKLSAFLCIQYMFLVLGISIKIYLVVILICIIRYIIKTPFTNTESYFHRNLFLYLIVLINSIIVIFNRSL